MSAASAKSRRSATQQAVDAALAVPGNEAERTALVEAALNRRLALVLLDPGTITLTGVKEVREILTVLRSLRSDGGGCIVLHWDEHGAAASAAEPSSVQPPFIHATP